MNESSPFQRVDKVGTLADIEKRRYIYEIVFVGAQWYVRERFRKKQEKTGILDESPSLKI